MPITFPFDTTGLSPANKIVDEPHSLTEINNATYRVIIPEFAPFYLDNFQLKHVDDLGVSTPLIADVDYYLCLPYIGATRSIGKMLYGGVTINNSYVNGHLALTYQTLGGDWVADRLYVLQRLADMMYNPRITVWDQVTNIQEVFPPVNHDQQFDYVYGHKELIEAVQALSAAILEGPDDSNGVIHHITQIGNAHNMTATDIDLGNVANYPMADDAECQAKALVNKYVTLRQIVQFLLDYTQEFQDIRNELTATQQNLSVLFNRIEALNQVENLPVATDTEVANETPVRKYVTLEQVLNLLNP